MKNNEKAKALFDEGYALEEGLKIDDKSHQDYDKAIKKYLEAGESGYVDGICRAGYVYQFFKGDIPKAIKLYKEAVDKGSANAKFLLGNCYYDGIGITQDPVEGCRLRNEALHEGSALAQSWFLKITKQFPK